MSERRREWRYNCDDHMTDEELAIERVAEENRAAMLTRPLVYRDEDYPPVASEAEPQERRY